MTDSLLVILDDAIAGSLTRLPTGKLRFDYHDAYRVRADALIPLHAEARTVLDEFARADLVWKQGPAVTRLLRW
jgi:hypothetical protein